MEQDSIETMYGKGTRIKIHSVDEALSSKSIVLEVVIILGDVINEQVMERALADYLVRDYTSIFFPEHTIKTLVRWDS